MPSPNAYLQAELAALSRTVVAHQDIIVDQQHLNQIEAQRDREISLSLEAMRESLNAARDFSKAIQEVAAALQQQITDMKAENALTHVAISIIAAEAEPRTRHRLLSVLGTPSRELFTGSQFAGEFNDRLDRAAQSLRAAITLNVRSEPIESDPL